MDPRTRSPFRRAIRPPLVLLTIALACAATGAQGSIHGLHFGSEEVVEVGVDDPSLAAAPAVIHPIRYSTARDSLWFVAFVKANDIYVAVRGPSGWHAPMRVSNDPAVSRAPSLGEFRDGLCVVWEDERTGHPEIWTRSWDGTSWSSEECLTLDDIASSAPSFDSDGEWGLVAWQDDPVGGPRRVAARAWNDGTWFPPETLSHAPAEAYEPAVSRGDFSRSTIVWTDRRDGGAEIYGCDLYSPGNVGPEFRLTNLAGECGHASISDQPCCGDAIYALRLVAFENDASGRSEVYGVCFEDGFAGSAVPISTLDAVASKAPRVRGRTFFVDEIPGGPQPQYSIAWEDVPAVGPATVRLAQTASCTQSDGAELISVNAAPGVQVGAASAQRLEDPNSRVLVVWPEMRSGLMTLLAREGSGPGCYSLEVTAPRALLLTPEGTITTRANYFDGCSGAAGPLTPFELQMSSALKSALKWDPVFPQPPMIRNSNTEGNADFVLHGGGCSQAGAASLRVQGLVVWAWSGAKSPDVDGDCAVRDNDVAYVASRVGSADFCADLDGSGTVDGADVAIAEATRGDHCFNVVDAGDSPPAIDARAQVFPNPMHSSAVLRFDLPAAGPIEVSILDVSGRVVRAWPIFEGALGENLILFDGRGDGGESLPAGWYLARALTSRGALTTPLIRLE